MPSAALESLARTMEQFEDARAKRPDVKPAAEQSSDQDSPGVVAPEDKKSIVH
jgi:hypothetical protein